jgi:ElaB/YqjD/DUF883 family membrane-anchored ribosome-binding protein
MPEEQNIKQKDDELYRAAEAASAVRLAKKVLNTASQQEMEYEEKKEFDRIKQMVEKADFVEHPPRPPIGSAASVWLNFLEAYMRTVLYNHDELKAEIDSTFKRAKEKFKR